MKRMQDTQEKVLSQLGLTSDQKKQVKGLNKTTADSFKKLMDASNGQRPDREAMRGVMKSHREGLMKILTKDQQTKFKDLMKAQMEKMRAERGGGAGAPPQKP